MTSRLSKYDITRAGQIDGERRAFSLIARGAARTRGEIEYLLTPRIVDEVVDAAGRSAEHDYLPSLGGRRTRTPRERSWYEAAFRAEYTRALRRAYNEAPSGDPSRRPRRPMRSARDRAALHISQGPERARVGDVVYLAGRPAEEVDRYLRGLEARGLTLYYKGPGDRYVVRRERD